MVATDWGVVTTRYPGCFWSPCASDPVVSGSGAEGRECLRASWTRRSPAQQAAARLVGGWGPRRGAETEGRAEGWWSKRKLRTTTKEGGGRPGPQAPPRLWVSPAAGGWMGLLQAVVAALKVAAAAAAVSAVSTNHPSPLVLLGMRGSWGVLGPLSFLPLPHLRGPPGRPLTSGEGLRENAPSSLPLPECAGHARRMRSPSPTPTGSEPDLLLWR